MLKHKLYQQFIFLNQSYLKPIQTNNLLIWKLKILQSIDSHFLEYNAFLGTFPKTNDYTSHLSHTESKCSNIYFSSTKFLIETIF